MGASFKTTCLLGPTWLVSEERKWGQEGLGEV